MAVVRKLLYLCLPVCQTLCLSVPDTVINLSICRLVTTHGSTQAAFILYIVMSTRSDKLAAFNEAACFRIDKCICDKDIGLFTPSSELNKKSKVCFLGRACKVGRELSFWFIYLGVELLNFIYIRNTIIKTIK